MMLYQCTTYCFVTLRFSVTLWILHWCTVALKLGWARGRLVALDAPLRARLGDTNSLDQDIFQLATFQSSQTRYILFTFSKAFFPMQRARLGDTNSMAKATFRLGIIQLVTQYLVIFQLNFLQLFIPAWSCSKDREVDWEITMLSVDYHLCSKIGQRQHIPYWQHLSPNKKLDLILNTYSVLAGQGYILPGYLLACNVSF